MNYLFTKSQHDTVHTPCQKEHTVVKLHGVSCINSTQRWKQPVSLATQLFCSIVNTIKKIEQGSEKMSCWITLFQSNYCAACCPKRFFCQRAFLPCFLSNIMVGLLLFSVDGGLHSLRGIGFVQKALFLRNLSWEVLWTLLADCL